MKLPRYKCLRCKHVWIPRKESKPTICPKCKSVCWNDKNINISNLVDD